ncbi:MAG: hypothetical protein V7L31_02970 [Nostoc sp.]
MATVFVNTSIITLMSAIAITALSQRILLARFQVKNPLHLAASIE